MYSSIYIFYIFYIHLYSHSNLPNPEFTAGFSQYLTSPLALPGRSFCRFSLSALILFAQVLNTESCPWAHSAHSIWHLEVSPDQSVDRPIYLPIHQFLSVHNLGDFLTAIWDKRLGVCQLLQFLRTLCGVVGWLTLKGFFQGPAVAGWVSM